MSDASATPLLAVRGVSRRFGVVQALDGVSLDIRSGEVLALVGGYGFRAGGFDRSQRAQRQPGSAFKPFLYAAAIESGKYTAASVVNDAPEAYATAFGDPDCLKMVLDWRDFS